MDDQHSVTYDSYQQAKGDGEEDLEQLHDSQPPTYHQEQTRHRNQPRQNAFSTPVRSSHAEAQAALEAVAAAANAGKIQMSPPASAQSPAAAVAAAAAASASTSEPSSPGVSSSPFSTHLGRNKACQSCRARKLKCDGQRPVCGQCAKGWQIKFRMAQNKAKSKKKGESPAQSEGEGLPDYMPACEYLPISQRGSTRSARLAGDDSMDHDSPGPSAPASTSTTPAKKRKRADENPEEQIARLQAEVARLRRQLAQVTGVVDGQSANLANALQNQRHQQQDGGDQGDRLPSKDELAIAHMLATSMPSGEGSSSSTTSFDYQQHAAAVAAAAAASLNDDNVDVFDPALNESSAAPPTTADAVSGTDSTQPNADVQSS